MLSMRTRMHTRKSPTSLLLVPLFLLAAFAPITVSASSVIDIANTIRTALASGSQTTPCYNEETDGCSTFLNNPTPTTFANLRPTTVSSILNYPAVSTLVPTLSAGTFTNFSTTNLTVSLQRLLPTVLQSFSPTVFSSLPTGTISGILSGVSPSTLTSLSGSLLTGISTGNLTSILSSVSPGLLGSLPPSIFSSLPSGTISGLLSSGGLSSNVISSLGGNLLGGLTSGTLNGALGGLSSGALGGLAPSLFSSVSPSIMSALPAGITSALPSSVTSLIPGIGGGGFGIFVPVNDIQLNSAFAAYSARFSQHAADMKSALTGAPDSIRDIIAGNDPGGVADPAGGDNGNCAVDTYAGSTQLVPWQNPNGPWADAIASSTDENGVQLFPPLPNDLTNDVHVNASGSLRCILQDLVGYQKISLFVQIQSMLKQYIADAQQQQLSNQLLNQINGANLNWAKQGNKVTADGVVTTEPVYVLNTDQSQKARDARTVDTIIRKAAAPVGDVGGSYALNWPLETASAVAKNNAPDNSLEIPCPLTGADSPFPAAANGPAAFENYMNDANTSEGLGAIDTFAFMLNNPKCTPIGEVTMVQGAVDEALAQDKKNYAQDLANSGFQPTYECSGLPSDTDCDPALMKKISPPAQNERLITDALASGNEEIANSDTLDTSSANAAETLSTEANTEEGGIAGYDTTALMSSKTAVNALIYELYDTIGNAYFDLTEDQTNWSQAALLMIYDEMKFNSSAPQTVVPSADSNSAVDEVPLDY